MKYNAHLDAHRENRPSPQVIELARVLDAYRDEQEGVSARDWPTPDAIGQATYVIRSYAMRCFG